MNASSIIIIIIIIIVLVLLLLLLIIVITIYTAPFLQVSKGALQTTQNLKKVKIISKIIVPKCTVSKINK